MSFRVFRLRSLRTAVAWRSVVLRQRRHRSSNAARDFHPIHVDRLRQPADGNRFEFLRLDHVAHQHEGGIRDQDLARTSHRAEARAEIHLVADRRVVEPIVAADAAENDVSGYDADADFERPAVRGTSSVSIWR